MSVATVKEKGHRLQTFGKQHHSVISNFRDILNTGPVVSPHLQKSAHRHAQPNAATVTQEDVQNHLVPPALGKIRQQMHEEELKGTTCET